jgi:metallo-beta-lactamase family protein
MDVRVKFLGGAGTVTGSKYLLEIDDFRLLVDCGLFQGLKELRLRNREPIPIDPSQIDAVVLTHAHLDHCGYLPKLFKDGFDGPVYCTVPTVDLVKLILRDSAKLQEEEAEFARKKGYSKHANPQPLYEQKDVEAVLPKLRGHSYHVQVRITENIECSFYNAGHILGASIVKLTITGISQTKTIVFSGDLGRTSDPILFAPESPGNADILFIESTYGSREHNEVTSESEIQRYLTETFDRGGSLLIPAFSVGRTQNILMILKNLLMKKAIPEIPIFMDSPMAIRATDLYRRYVSYHKLTEQEIEGEDSFISLRRNLRIIRTHQESKAINNHLGPAVIISASGMMTGGRVLHHLYNRLQNPNDSVLIVGYQAEGTRGRRLLDGEPSLKIFGVDVPVKSRIYFAEGMSAHADQSELLDWCQLIKERPKMTFCIHGDKDGPSELAKMIKSRFGWNSIVPEYLESVQLFRSI